MKLIIIRGNSGSGKTIITDTLADKLGAEKIHIDDFKSVILRDLRVKNKPIVLNDICKEAMMEAIALLEKMKSGGAPLVIMEELFYNEKFTEELNKYCVDNNVDVQWFRIEREMEKNVEMQESPERVSREIRNSKEDIEMMESQIRENVIEGERVILNNGIIEDAIREFLVNISREGVKKEISSEFKIPRY